MMKFNKYFGVCLVLGVVFNSLIVSQLDAYGGDQHEGLTKRSLDLKEKTHGSNSDFWNEVGFSDYQKAIKDGCKAEDNWLQMRYHFYDPTKPEGKQGFKGIFQDALSRANELFNQAISLYQDNKKPEAYEKFGHVLHLVQDMSVPEHAADISHIISDTYEKYVKSYWNGWINGPGGYIDTHMEYFKNIQPDTLKDFFNQCANFSRGFPYGDAWKSLDEFSKMNTVEHLVSQGIQYGAGMINQFWDNRNMPNPNDPGKDHPDDNYGVLSAPTLFLDPDYIGDWKNYIRVAMKKGKLGVLWYKEYTDLLAELDTFPEETPEFQQKAIEVEKFEESTLIPNADKIRNDYDTTPDVLVLQHGFFDAWDTLLIKKFCEPMTRVLEFDPKKYLPKDQPVLVIPSAGFFGMDSSAIFKWQLREYVEAGGVLISFAQQQGYEFSCLPGGEVKGYGWGEDQSCWTNAAYVDTYKPCFAGQESANLDVNVDGYFTQWPDNATILLRRTKNRMPCMIMYPYGKGWVIASTLYSDWGYGHNHTSNAEVKLIRDLISWAKDINKEIPELKPCDPIDLNVEVTNNTDNYANKVILTLIDPDRNIIGSHTVLTSLPSHQTTKVNFTSSLIPHPSSLGIWWIDYELQDTAGNTIQPQTEGERFAISRHLVFELDWGWWLKLGK